MTPPRSDPRAGEHGFSFAELLVTIAIISIAALIGLPALQNQIIKSKLEGFARTATINLQVARQEAIKSGRPVVVEFENFRMFAFVDITGDDLEYTEDLTAVYKTADYMVWSLPLPVALEGDGATVRDASVLFSAPDDSDGQPFVGLTDVGGKKKLIYDPDGSVRDVGAFRFGDFRPPGAFSTSLNGPCGNCFQVGISPAATGKAHLMKWDHDLDVFLPRGRQGNGTATEGQNWVWY